MSTCHDLMHLHIATAQSMADAETRNDHLREAAVAMAAVGEVNLARDILPCIDDAVFQCWGWVEVALSLARTRHLAAASVLDTATASLADTITIDDDLRAELTARLAIATALIGDVDFAGHHIDEALARLSGIPGREERTEVAALIIEAAALVGRSNALVIGRETAMTAIEEEFCDPKGHYWKGERCATFLAAALYGIQKHAEARALIQSTAMWVVAGIGDQDTQCSPLRGAMSLLELATSTADMGDVPLACHVAGMALGLRNHPDVRFKADFDPDGTYLPFVEFFNACAYAQAKSGQEPQTIESMRFARELECREGKYFIGILRNDEWTTIPRRLRQFETLLVIGRLAEAKTCLVRAGLLFERAWERTRQHGREIDSDLYPLVKIAGGWARLERDLRAAEASP